MPIYEYVASCDTPCEECREPFEVVQAMSDPALTECPYCGQPVKRLISGFLLGKGNLLKPANLERHGFTQYVRKGKGYYEKTAGSGPDVIRDGRAERS
jgi:putative FmdB family regulatory protein